MSLIEENKMSRMRLLVWLTLAVLVAQNGRAQNDASKYNATQVQKAIVSFSADPMSERGQAMMSVIMAFAEESDQVEIQIVMSAEKSVTKWLVHEPRTKELNALFTALFAGNIRSQLDTGVIGDDSYSGFLFVFKVYHRIKRDQPNFKVPEIEELIAIHRKRRLYSHLKAHSSSEEEPKDTRNTSKPRP